MTTLIGGLIIFALLALLVLGMLSSEDRAKTLAGPAAIAVWFVYLVHADTVFTATYLDIGRIAVGKAPAFALGGAIIVAGFALFAWATRTLARRGDFAGIRARRLVIEGPYRLMRQPQNTGWGMMLLGIAIAGRSWISLILVAIFAVFVFFFERAEERTLRADFGDAFARWRNVTPLLPSLRRMAPAHERPAA